MLNDDDLNPAIDKPITDEFRAQKAEGKRRQRMYEGIDLARLSTLGGCVGTHKLPSIEEVEKFWTDGETAHDSLPELALYQGDREGLHRELIDLERDAANMALWLNVSFEGEKK